MECRSEVRCSSVFHTKAPMATTTLAHNMGVLFFFLPELHYVVELGLDVSEDGQTGQVAQTASLVGQVLLFKHINL